jgi:hypothetical protein
MAAVGAPASTAAAAPSFADMVKTIQQKKGVRGIIVLNRGASGDRCCCFVVLCFLFLLLYLDVRTFVAGKAVIVVVAPCCKKYK